MQKKIFILALLCLSIYSYSAESWSKLGGVALSPSNGANTTIALASNGTPYVGYKEGGTYGYKMSVCKFTNNAWSVVGSYGFNNSPVNYPTIAVDGNGILYAAFAEEGNSNKLYAMKYDGTSWSYLGSGSISSGEISFTSIAVDKNNKVYVAYRDHSLGYQACVKTWNTTTSTWDYVGSSAFSSGPVDFLSLAFDSNNTPYVAFKDESGGYKLSVMKFDGTAWGYVGGRSISSVVAGGSNSQGVISIAFNSSNTPYVAYINENYSNKACLVKFNGTTWDYIGNTSSSYVVSSGEVSFISLTFGSNDNLYLTYRDHSLGYLSFVQKYNGTSWSFIGTGTGFSSYASDYNNIVVNKSTGTIYVAMTEEGASNNQCFVWSYSDNTTTSNTELKNSLPKVSKIQGGIRLEQLSDGQLQIYSTDGLLVHQSLVTDNKALVQLSPGIYIIKNSINTLKIISL